MSDPVHLSELTEAVCLYLYTEFNPPNGTSDFHTFIKSQKGLPLEKKNTQNHEYRRLGLIESFQMQHCSMRGCIRPL